MNNRTQLMIGVALFGIVAVLFVLPEFRAGKLEGKQAEKKVSEQAAAEPKKKTQVTLEPEVASEQAAVVGVRDKQSGLETEPESSPDPDGSETFEGEETPEPEESEAPINPIRPRRILLAKPSATPLMIAVPQSGPITRSPRSLA